MKINDITKKLKYENIIEYLNFVEKCRQDNLYYSNFEKNNSAKLFKYADILIHSHYSFKFIFKNCIETYTVLKADCKTRFNKKTKVQETLPGSVNVSLKLFMTDLTGNNCDVSSHYYSFKDFNSYFINNDFEIIDEKYN